MQVRHSLSYFGYSELRQHRFRIRRQFARLEDDAQVHTLGRVPERGNKRGELRRIVGKQPVSVEHEQHERAVCSRVDERIERVELDLERAPDLCERIGSRPRCTPGDEADVDLVIVRLPSHQPGAG